MGTGFGGILLRLFASSIFLAEAQAAAPPLVLRVDVRNLVGAEGQGQVPARELSRAVGRANRVWSQCDIRFRARSAANVSAERLRVPYFPKSQADLSAIAGALNPDGPGGAIPLTIAGPWDFLDPASGLYLHGLGWVFSNGAKLDRIGAMISRHLLGTARDGQLLAHELGHALSLGHSAEPDNVMAGGDRLTPAQCEQARSFAALALTELTEPGDRLARSR